MIPHTQAFMRFREQGNQLLDHAVLVSYALPTLEQEIDNQSGPVSGVLPKQYFFKNSNLSFEELASRLKKSDEAFGKEVLVSLFSYFDAYFIDLLKEVIEFHGGALAQGKVFVRYVASWLKHNGERGKAKLLRWSIRRKRSFQARCCPPTRGIARATDIWLNRR